MGPPQHPRQMKQEVYVEVWSSYILTANQAPSSNVLTDHFNKLEAAYHLKIQSLYFGKSYKNEQKNHEY